MEAEDVRVELGCITFSELRRDALALRMAEVHSSRSCSLAVAPEKS